MNHTLPHPQPFPRGRKGAVPLFLRERGQGSPILNQCQINTYSIDIGGTRTLYDAQVTLNTMGNYRYIDTVSFSNIEEDPSGTGIIVFEPTPSLPGIYTWDFGKDIKPQGTIKFRMKQICGAGKDWSASGKFNNKCENDTELPLRNATPNPDSDTPILLRGGIPTLHLVPAQIFANNRFPEEQLFVVNGGSGPMYNATLTLQLDADLEYYAHAVSIGSGPDTVTVSFANVKPVANAGGNQAVVVGQTVLLNGSASSDANGDPLTFNWTFVSKPANSQATLTAPGPAQTS